jgi:hypothetical protein
MEYIPDPGLNLVIPARSSSTLRLGAERSLCFRIERAPIMSWQSVSEETRKRIPLYNLGLLLWYQVIYRAPSGMCAWPVADVPPVFSLGRSGLKSDSVYPNLRANSFEIIFPWRHPVSKVHRACWCNSVPIFSEDTAWTVRIQGHSPFANI